MTRRLSLAGLVHQIAPNQYAIGGSDRAGRVTGWLPHVFNNVAAARIVAGLDLGDDLFPARRITSCCLSP